MLRMSERTAADESPWAARDRRYEQLRAEGYGPSHAQDVVDGLGAAHDPAACGGCLDET